MRLSRDCGRRSKLSLVEAKLSSAKLHCCVRLDVLTSKPLVFFLKNGSPTATTASTQNVTSLNVSHVVFLIADFFN